MDLGWTEDRDHAGFFAGFLQSSNALGRVFTAGLWGLCGERFGYGPCLMAAFVSILIGDVLFGLCTEPTSALIVRFLFLGAGNGWGTLCGPVFAEVAGPDRQTDVASAVISLGAFVQLFGPALGGWTYGAFDRFPAFVPSYIGAGLAVAALAALRRWPVGMPESSEGEKNGCSGTSIKSVLPLPSLASANGAWALLCEPGPLRMVVILRAMQGGVCFAMFDVVPLWAISTRELGGLDLSEDEVGLVLAASAIVTIMFTWFLTPKLTRRWGLRRCFVMANCVGAMAILAMPWSQGWRMLTILHSAVNVATSMIGVISIGFTNNSTPQGLRGPVNGMAVTVESLAKGLGPMTGAWLCMEPGAFWPCWS